MRVEPRQQVHWITHEEADALLKALPSHLALAAEYSLATILRQANVLGLPWSQIDFERRHAWIHTDQAKVKRDLAVPLMTTLWLFCGAVVTSIPGTASPIEETRCRKWWRTGPGKRRVSVPASQTFVGMICAIPGSAGM